MFEFRDLAMLFFFFQIKISKKIDRLSKWRGNLLGRSEEKTLSGGVTC